jgi:hypothetical protein
MSFTSTRTSIFGAGRAMVSRMASRLRRGDASGPAEWLLAFLQARDNPPRARAGSAAGPTEWLLVFLGAATATPSTTTVTVTRAATATQAAAMATGRSGRSRVADEGDSAYADDPFAGFGEETR